jgi:hypothetical protein
MEEAVAAAARTVQVETDDAADIIEEELRRLVIDGYILGRIEQDTEGRNLRFKAPSDVPWFVLSATRIMHDGLQRSVFSPALDPETAELLQQFSQDALQSVTAAGGLPAGSDSRSASIALATACGMGREVALLEGLFLDPAERQQLDAILAVIDANAVDRIEQDLLPLPNEPARTAQAVQASVLAELTGTVRA